MVLLIMEVLDFVKVERNVFFIYIQFAFSTTKNKHADVELFYTA